MTGLWAFEVQVPYQKYQGPPIVVRWRSLNEFQRCKKSTWFCYQKTKVGSFFALDIISLTWKKKERNSVKYHKKYGKDHKEYYNVYCRKKACIWPVWCSCRDRQRSSINYVSALERRHPQCFKLLDWILSYYWFTAHSFSASYCHQGADLLLLVLSGKDL